jgi:hypothetical protein
MTTQTLSTLIQKLSESCGDYLAVATTTNITTNNSIVSTTLNQYDYGEDDHFNNWWVYLNTTANPSVERRISNYTTATGTLAIAGAALAAESGSVDVYIFQYPRVHYKQAIIEACNEIYPALHKTIDNQTLVTGNILPDGHFEEWDSASSLTYYSALSGTLAQTSTAGLTRGGTYSAKYTAGAANDYFYIDSDSYPRLLELQDKTVDLFVPAYPEDANDAYIQIATVSTNSSTQTLTSTTPCAAAMFTQLKLESQKLNDNLEYISIRFGVTTNGKYAYFDDAFLCGMPLAQYLLPTEFNGGYVSQTIIQTTGNSDEWFYDINPFMVRSGELIPHGVISNNSWLLIDAQPVERRLRLRGFAPLETLSDDTDTITLENGKVPLLIALARMLFWEREAPPVSEDDKAKFNTEYSRAARRYYELKSTHQMARPIETLKRL